jgi:GWxTD domain-containing protein
MRVLDRTKRPILVDTVRLARHREVLSGTATLRVACLGWGALYVELQSPKGTSALVPVIVSFGEGLVVTTYDEMMEYLRFYVSPERLRALRDAIPEQRPSVWAKFLRETDPAPATVEHEGLRGYFNLVEQANARFHDEGIPGWMTNRGMVYVTLGEPDNIYEPRSPQSLERGRAQVWEYTRHRIQLMFVDATGFGKWELAPYSEAEFASVARRVRVQ